MKGAAQEASPSLICGTSLSSSISASLSVIVETSNCTQRQSCRTRRWERATDLLNDTLLSPSSDRFSSGFLSSDGVGEEIRNERRYRRRDLTKPRRNLKLLLINPLNPLPFLMLHNRLQIILRPIQQRNTNVRLLERSDVVRSISRHESDVTERFERREDEFFLRRGDSSVDPRLLYELDPGGSFGVLSKSGSGHANVVAVEERFVDGIFWVDGNDDALVWRPPGKICSRLSVSVLDREKEKLTSFVGRTFSMIQNENFSIDNLHLHSDVSSSKRIIPSNHDASMRGRIELLDSRDRIRFKRTMKDEESSEL